LSTLEILGVAQKRVNSRLRRRQLAAMLFGGLCWTCTWLALVMLVVLLYSVSSDGVGYFWDRTLASPAAIRIMASRDDGFVERAEGLVPEFAETFAPLDTSEYEAAILTAQQALAQAEDQPAREDAASTLAGAQDDLIQAREDKHEEQSALLEELRKEDAETLAQLGIRLTPAERLASLGQLIAGFLSKFPSRHTYAAGIKSAVFGTLWIIGLTALLAIPIGVLGAVYLEEYSRQNKLARFIEVNISNLAGVPSIVYGLLGLTIFVGTFHKLKQAFPDSERFVEPQNILCGALTMTLLILPVIIIASREAIKAVPTSLRQAAFAVGATRWQVVSQQVLPAAIPGIVTGVILAVSRAMGETAPLITIGALTYVAFTPRSVFDGFTVLPIQIYNWISRPQEEFHYIAAAAILVLMAVLLLMNSVAIFIRNHFERKIKW
jgi:phosphate transport system permease protein